MVDAHQITGWNRECVICGYKWDARNHHQRAGRG